MFSGRVIDEPPLVRARNNAEAEVRLRYADFLRDAGFRKEALSQYREALALARQEEQQSIRDRLEQLETSSSQPPVGNAVPAP